MATHRLEPAKRTDVILVFDKGRLVAQGRHEDMFRQDGVYKEMWEAYIT